MRRIRLGRVLEVGLRSRSRSRSSVIVTSTTRVLTPAAAATRCSSAATSVAVMGVGRVRLAVARMTPRGRWWRRRRCVTVARHGSREVWARYSIGRTLVCGIASRCIVAGCPVRGEGATTASRAGERGWPLEPLGGCKARPTMNLRMKTSRQMREENVGTGRSGSEKRREKPCNGSCFA